MAVRLRFFADEGAVFPLWGEEDDPWQLERRLPIPDDLLGRMRDWMTEFNRRTLEEVPEPWTSELLEEFDRRGYLLSRELQRVLGSGYQVDYLFETPSVRESAKTAGGSHAPEAAPHPRRLAELLRAVAVLALPASVQRDWLATRGEPLRGDSLVIDIYETAPEGEQFLLAGWISRRAASRIAELNGLLNEMSGPDSQHLWSSEALDSSYEWGRVRSLALSVLAEL